MSLQQKARTMTGLLSLFAGSGILLRSHTSLSFFAVILSPQCISMYSILKCFSMPLQSGLTLLLLIELLCQTAQSYTSLHIHCIRSLLQFLYNHVTIQPRVCTLVLQFVCMYITVTHQLCRGAHAQARYTVVCLCVCVSVCVDRYSCSRMNQVQVRISIGFQSCLLGY